MCTNAKLSIIDEVRAITQNYNHLTRNYLVIFICTILIPSLNAQNIGRGVSLNLSYSHMFSRDRHCIRQYPGGHCISYINSLSALHSFWIH